MESAGLLGRDTLFLGTHPVFWKPLEPGPDPSAEVLLYEAFVEPARLIVLSLAVLSPMPDNDEPLGHARVAACDAAGFGLSIMFAVILADNVRTPSFGSFLSVVLNIPDFLSGLGVREDLLGSKGGGGGAIEDKTDGGVTRAICGGFRDRVPSELFFDTYDGLEGACLVGTDGRARYP